MVEDDESDFVTQAFKKRRVEASSTYIDTKFLLPTSNHVERLFSLCKRVYAPNRRSLTPETFEALVFLKTNKNMWSVRTVAQIFTQDVAENVESSEDQCSTDDEDF